MHPCLTNLNVINKQIKVMYNSKYSLVRNHVCVAQSFLITGFPYVGIRCSRENEYLYKQATRRLTKLFIHNTVISSIFAVIHNTVNNNVKVAIKYRRFLIFFNDPSLYFFSMLFEL